MLFWVGKHIYIHVLFIYVVHSSPFLCVCGDDRITCYPEADDVTGGPGDTQTRSEGQQGDILYMYMDVYLFSFAKIM